MEHAVAAAACDTADRMVGAVRRSWVCRHLRARSSWVSACSSRDHTCADPLGGPRHRCPARDDGAQEATERRGAAGVPVGVELRQRAYGLLLGLLVVTAVGHLTDVRTEAQKEASSLIALYDTLNVYTPETREPVQHDLVCYMRSIADDEWPAMARGGHLEATRTLGFGDRLRAQLRTLPTDGSAQASAYGRAGTLVTDAGQSRQRLLFLTAPEIPTILWVMIYVGAFLVFFLLALHYAERPDGLVVVLASVIVLMTVVVAVLSMLDQPFSFGVQVQPSRCAKPSSSWGEVTRRTRRSCGRAADLGSTRSATAPGERRRDRQNRLRGGHGPPARSISPLRRRPRRAGRRSGTSRPSCLQRRPWRSLAPSLRASRNAW